MYHFKSRPMTSKFRLNVKEGKATDAPLLEDAEVKLFFRGDPFTAQRLERAIRAAMANPEDFDPDDNPVKSLAE